MTNIVLCCDPASATPYRLNLLSGACSYEPLLAEYDFTQEIDQLNSLNSLETCDWEFKSDACETYRKRKLRQALLQKSASQFPAYTTSRELSPAFADKTDIRLIVDLGMYVGENSGLLQDSRGEFDKLGEESEFASFVYRSIDHILEIKASLVTSANEVLKNMLTDVYKHFRVKIRPKSPSNVLTFKVSGKREYLVGNHPMLAYESVRAALREMEWLNVKLTEIPSESAEFFPPVVSVEGEEPLRLPGRIPYALFWYPPVQVDQSDPVVVHNVDRPQLYLPRLHHLLSAAPRKLTEESCKRLLSSATLEPPTVFTGQCDWPFRIRVCGCQRLEKLFEEGLWGSATHVGIVTPSFIVRPNTKKETHRSTSQSEIDSPGKSKAVSRITVTSNRHSTVALHSSFSNFAIGNAGLATDMASLFKLPFRLRQLRFEVMLVYGESLLRQCNICTQSLAFTLNPRLYEWVNFDIRISELPKETRVCVNIYGGGEIGMGEECRIGCASKSLFDEFGNIRSGLQALNVWPFYMIEERLACMGDFWGKANVTTTGSASSAPHESHESDYCQLYLQFDTFLTPTAQWSLRDNDHMKGWYRSLGQSYVYQPATDTRATAKSKPWSAWLVQQVKESRGQGRVDEDDSTLIQQKPTIDDLAGLEAVLAKDSLQDLDEEERRLLFVCRDHYKSLSSALPMFLRAVDWSRPVQVSEARKMLQTWSHMPPTEGLLLLDAEFPDEEVRLYGIRMIARMADDELTMYMQQFVQALQFETHHLSYLSELLLERALKNPFEVGHELFWALRAQLHFKPAAERFALLLEQFLMLCGRYRQELAAEVQMVNWFKDIGGKIKQVSTDRQEPLLIQSLSEGEDTYNFPFTLAFDSRLQCQGFNSQRCKVFSSKKLPLLVRLRNFEEGCGEVPIIFKVGDDMRQDMLTIQLIRVMDSIWLENGLDLRMKTYRVTATHDQVGMVEFVTRSKTTNEIQKEYGGKFGAFKKEPLKEFLSQYNKDEDLFMRSVDNFIRSCAGYCVATYILGIGDRHNDNIMMSETGHLFHIDFGHFLGNFKSKFGIKRERTPFVFTEEMAFVMEGKDSESFHAFNDYCCLAYNQIRKVGRRFINLFKMMISAGMPELQRKEDIVYLRDMLSLQMTDMEADMKFRGEILNALSNTFRRFDNWLHAKKHSK